MHLKVLERTMFEKGGQLVLTDFGVCPLVELCLSGERLDKDDKLQHLNIVKRVLYND